ncbi:drs2 neo1 protein [Entomophthora muscae]|uniref:Drs2 neo1 protein n=1 Tax=Entomophthora muscae TaxID=34485 RepID=A0ACC2U5S8_9FUNG|nr:drs2 neo1 protein [Entomophthora muscae]
MLDCFKHLWLRWLNRGSTSGEHQSRRVNLTPSSQFPTNVIRTSKYTLWSFIPINIYVQFSNFVNIYFLIISIIQFIPGASPVGKISTIVPLSAFIVLAMLHEAYDDLKRHQMDHEENNREVAVLSTVVSIDTKDCIAMEELQPTWTNKRWSELLVGNIIKVEEDQWVPADLILLASAREDGSCYLETAALDGESSLKKLQALQPLQDIITPEGRVDRLRGHVDIEEPTLDLYSIEGNLHTDGEQFPLHITNAMLRGSIVRNTSHVFGLVVYSGEQTKVRLNASRNIKAKIPSINYAVNRAVLTAFVLLILLASLATALNFQWEKTESHKAWYLGRAPPGAKNIVLNFLSFIVLLNTIVPISLFFSLEFCKLFQAYFITQDKEMYHHPTDTPAHFHTTALNDDLGMVSHIFSDKTGTLTENAMHFRRMYAFGSNHALNRRQSVTNASKETRLRSEALHSLSLAQLQSALSLNPSISLAVLGMALCHTVNPDLNPKTGELTFQATSPDELALLQAARDLGLVLIKRDSQSVTLELREKPVGNHTQYQFQILDVIEFSSDRKRMSVVVRFPGASGVVVFSKGADATMLPLLSLDQSTQATQEAIECMYAYSCQGLRTLVYAYRPMTLESYQEWRCSYQKASSSLGDGRADEMAEVASQLESDMALLSATGLEDRLQKGVPQAIASLRAAGIKIWVLTGDKRETAINIGRSCSLISPETPTVVIDIAQTELHLQLKSALGSWQDGSSLIVDGATFAHLEARGGDELPLFLDLATRASSVILCRSSPAQKAKVVRLMRERIRHGVTLAIGDGGNDVAMIQEAHVGIGISGNEGLMAARSSDYSIAQFRFLVPLILVHGRWNYYRCSRLILLTFYKVMTFYFSQYLYQYFTAFSGTSWYETWSFSLYNALYTISPVLVVGILEQDLPRDVLLEFPELYKDAGPAGQYFNVPLYIGTMLTSWIHSFLITVPYFVLTIWTGVSSDEPPSGPEMYFVGMSVYWTAVAVVSLWVIILSSRYCTLIHMAIATASLVVYWTTQFIFNLVYSPVSTLPVRGSLYLLMGSPQLWSNFIFTISAILAFKCVLRFIGPDVLLFVRWLRSRLSCTT